MPEAKDNSKMTGDNEAPDDKSPNADEAKPGRGINQAGFLKDRDAPTSDSYGNTRDSGETGQS